MTTNQDPPPEAVDDFAPHDLGERLRARRLEIGISLRELARRVGVSASLVSQIETGKVQPSVSTLYALASEVRASVDEMLFGEAPAARFAPDGDETVPGIAPLLLAHPPTTGLQRSDRRKAIRLNRGVVWERLTPMSAPGIEFLHVTYEAGAESSPPDAYQRHNGREWAYLVSGRLHVSVGFEEHVLEPGDSITYDSSTPHRLHNPGQEPAEAIWFVLG